MENHWKDTHISLWHIIDYNDFQNKYIFKCKKKSP